MHQLQATLKAAATKPPPPPPPQLLTSQSSYGSLPPSPGIRPSSARSPGSPRLSPSSATRSGGAGSGLRPSSRHSTGPRRPISALPTAGGGAPVTPVFVPPAPIDLDDAEALRCIHRPITDTSNNPDITSMGVILPYLMTYLMSSFNHCFLNLTFASFHMT